MGKLNMIPLLKKYRYALIVLALGMVLLLLPSGSKTETTPETVACQEVDIASELADILGQIRGAGRVEVMLTPANGQETIYQTNRNGDDFDTVTVTDAERNESGLVCQINPPIYLGAIIVCQGGDDPSVRLAIVEAVSKVTGLGADRISVLKMK